MNHQPKIEIKLKSKIIKLIDEIKLYSRIIKKINFEKEYGINEEDLHRINFLPVLIQIAENVMNDNDTRYFSPDWKQNGYYFQERNEEISETIDYLKPIAEKLEHSNLSDILEELTTENIFSKEINKRKEKIIKNKGEEKLMAKPRLFIGSSTEGLEVARAVQELLDRDAEVTIWEQGIFELSKISLEALLETLDKTDFGVFIFTSDDTIKMRGMQHHVARDNVIFELGLFIGQLGIEHNFILKPRGITDFHLPSDLLGITVADFDLNRSDGNIVAAVGSACNKIRRRLQKI